MLRKISREVWFRALVSVLALGSASASESGSAEFGTLEIVVKDQATDRVVPARVEVRGSDGVYYAAEDALLVGGDCNISNHGAGLVDLESTLATFSRQFENAYTKSTQFYSTGTSSIQLPTGKATIRVFRGPEYRVHTVETEIPKNQIIQHTVELSRWADMPKRGWYSSDEHLHIPRPARELNPYISQLMQAEDVHVANLLQMGKAVNFAIAPQYAHGPDSYYQDGDYILASGQENPRTHFLGHTITLGAEAPLHSPDEYLIYRSLLQKAVDQGALNGYAHYGSRFGGDLGLPVVLQHDLMHFIEVAQFNRSDYEAWYEVLNLGFRVAPTAGTDYPCGSNLPGHERFYTEVQGQFTYENWLAGVRAGRTFVTTGPLLEFSVNGKGIGEELTLGGPGAVHIEGKILFDPDQDDIRRVQLIENGQVVRSFPRTDSSGKIGFSIDHKVEETSWLALRGDGRRLNERLGVSPWHFGSFTPNSIVHSGAVYIGVTGTPSLTSHPRAKAIARAWLARLEHLESMLEPGDNEFLAGKLLGGAADGVPPDVVRTNRQALLDEIRSAKAFFARLIGRD